MPTDCDPVSRRIHGFDERVEIASIRQVMAAYALIVSRWTEVV